ncbi:uncharacterized protein LOC106057808 isoform X1 [Biomphalaria glabrata]|uniref:Uncharacterized protein LOC106057808 isoform X1 n=1 Tax=Biomphalaria glabrata TaxID=6526 RepID=A0A9W3ACP6_BIOGL|nr:uncharacterized protein LOC106057808 isoform X1 [Biomphalaria glabrata]
MKTYILLSVIAISVIFSANQHTAQACEDGWFGPECQYKCRCQQPCSPEGECPDMCEVGWFGYKCQYSLITYTATANQSQEDITELLNDDDETTCIDIGEQLIVLDLNRIYYNPWIRLFTPQQDLLYSLKISFLDRNSIAILATSNERLLVRDNIVDIHISVNDNFINYILLEGEVIQQLCTVWVISGQNVATKQNVYYSNSSINRIDTNLPQYPQASDGVYTCDESDAGHTGNYWEIVMNPSFVFKEFDFYVNDVFGVYRYFMFQAFDNDGEVSKTFSSNAWQSDEVYGIVDYWDNPIKAFTFFVTNYSTNKTLPLLLCEVEAFAECSEGTWGVHCTNTCNKNCPDLCRYDDGLCNNACFGYSDPPKCTKVCKTGSWGLNCTKTCSNHCYNSTCNSKSGVCDRGCLGYTDYPQCTRECETGFWGFNCVNHCDRCVDSSCNSKTGWCDRGCAGFSDPPFCSISCLTGSWGVNCTNKCSNSCVELSCDAKTGFCDRGCIATNCTLVLKTSESFSKVTIIAIAVSIGSAALLTIVICLIVLKVKGKLCFKRKENVRNLPQPPVEQYDEDPYDHLGKLEHEHYNEIDENKIPNSSNVYHMPAIQSRDEHTYHLQLPGIRKENDFYSKADNKDTEMNRERNPYIDVFDPKELRASYWSVSDAEDISDDLQSNGNNNTDPYQKQIVSF